MPRSNANANTDTPDANGPRVKPRAGTRFKRWMAGHSTNPDTRVEAAKATLSDPTTDHKGRVAARSELKAQGRQRHANVPLSTRLERLFHIRPAQKKAGITGDTGNMGSARRRNRG